MKSAQIGDLVTSVKKWNPARDSPNGHFTYIDINSVDRGRKAITEPVSIPTVDAPSRARQLVRANDVLVSTVRPNLNGVAEVPVGLDGATASTGFCVLRPNERLLHHRYLAFWVQSSRFVDTMVRLATGASYPAVTDKIIKNSMIPLPPLPEQRRIAAILDKADALRRKRHRALQLTDTFLRSAFLDMFGDPVANEKEWPNVHLGEILTGQRGGASFKPTDFQESGFPVLHKGGIKPGGLIELDPKKKTFACGSFVNAHASSVVDRQYVAVTLRDLVPAGPAIGLMTDLSTAKSDQFILAQGAYGYLPKLDQIEPAYLVWLSNNLAFRARLRSFAVGSTQIHIRTPIFLEIPIPLPDIETQRRFGDLVRHIQACRKQLVSSASHITLLVETLTSQAFRGDL